MKPTILMIGVIGIMILSHLAMKAQVSTPNNNGTVNDYVGWNSAQGFDLPIKHRGSYNINFFTSDTQRATILSGGNFGIGTQSPANLLHLYKPGTSASVLGQISNGNTSFPNGLRFGIDSSNAGMINMYDAKPLSFYTANTPRMTILGSTGHVGIGLNFNPGNDALDILPDANFPNTGIGFNNLTVLHNWGMQNIFVGVGAGSNNTTGSDNTFLGFQAGNLNMTANRNTFIGTQAGLSNTGNENIFIGFQAGQSNTGANNVFIGNAAGSSNTTGFHNVFVGFNSGNSNIAGNANTLVGFRSGVFNTGINNTFLGFQTGSTNTTGTNNTYVGYFARAAGANAATLTNAAAIGANATVTASNCMVLGDVGTPVNVGIGTTAPLNKLEIDADATSPTPSGLRLTDLASPPPGMVLTVNNSGDVILVPDATGGNVSVCAPGTTIPNRLTKWVSGTNLICNTIVFEDDVVPANTRIGIDIFTSPLRAKLDVNGGSEPLGLRVNGANQGAQFWGAYIGAAATANGANPIPPPTPPVIYIGLHGESLNASSHNYGAWSEAVTPSGTPVGTAPTGSALNTGGRGRAEGSEIQNTGLLGLAHYAQVDASNNLRNIGVSGSAALSSYQNFGGRFEAGNSSPFTNVPSVNCGVWGSAASNSLFNTGGYFDASGTGGLNFGIVATARNFGGLFLANSANILPGTAVGTYGIYANAGSGLSAFFQGTIASTAPNFTISDLTLKDSIQDISHPLAALRLLQPKTFVFKTDSFAPMNLPGGRRYGFISQALDTLEEFENLVEAVVQPEITDTNGTVLLDSFTFLGLNYTELLPVVVGAVKQLDSLTVKSCEPSSLTNRVTKWHDTQKTLCATRIMDDGERVGINAVDTAAAFTVITDTDTFAIQGEGMFAGGRFTGRQVGMYCLADGDATENDFPYIGVLGAVEKNSSNENVNLGVVGLSTHAAPDSVANAGMLGVGGASQFVNAGIGAFAGDFPLGEEEDTTNALNFGVYATSGKTTNENRAGFFQINTDEAQASVNIAVLGQVTGDSAHASNYWAGFFDGKVEITGDLVTPSDRMLKKNIEDIDNALEKLMQLQPRQYEYKTDEYENITLGKGRHYGLLADELKDVFPELVHEVTHPAQWKRTGKWLSGTVVHPQMSYSGINYLKLIPVFIQAMKEQQAIIDSLQASVQSMDDRLKALEAKEGVQYRMSDPGSEETVHEMTVELSTLQVVVLDQNVPNPFAESTSISYFIPEEAGAAKIMFFDLTGRILKTVDVQKGYGIITVFAPNLSSGTYSYSLVIDGRVAETRRMEKMR